MTGKRQRRDGQEALELIEEAVHLLRLAPGRVLAVYYLGSLPFVMGLLYFSADMSRSAEAFDRCAPAALAMALLFLWLKTWQAFFARELKAQVTGRPAQRLTVARLVRVAAIQTVLQPSGLFLIPLATIVALPFGWVYAFYQNVTAFGADDEVELKQVFQKSIRQAELWQKQNHLVLGILSLFGMVLVLDVAIGLATVPSLLKTLLGIETSFTRSSWSILNTTFLAAVCGVSWLCLDPLIKAIYTLRCFYGESLQTGEDLKVELKQFKAKRRIAVAVLVFCFGLLVPHDLKAASGGDRPPAPPANSQPEVQVPKWSPPDLDRAIEETISQREYSWRLPREKRAAVEKGIVASFMDGLFETLKAWFNSVKRWAKKVVNWVADLLDWLKEKIFGKDKVNTSQGEGGSGWMVSLRILVFVLLALVVCSVAILCWRVWSRRRREAVITSQAVALKPDVADENVVASQLPEDEWLKLARELMGRGELRLALRALYLASLAHLAQREMIHIAKFKSNRDYELELRRRARAQPDLQTAFAQNVTVFDRVWYGMHEATGELLQHFQTNLERIKAC